jgi:hypothetical protein
VIVNTSRVIESLTRAARTEHDFAGWLAYVLAQVAGQLGSADALTEGRPGSWESALVAQLVSGTVGYDGEALPPPRTRLTDAQVCDIRWRYGDGIGGVTQRQLAAEYRVSPSTISDITSGKTWRWLA